MLESHLIEKLRSIEQQYHELTGKLAAQIERNRPELQRIFKAIADLEETATTFNTWQKARLDLAGATQIIRESIDNWELHQLATLEIMELDRQIANLEHRLRVLLLPQDPDDESNVFLEIAAGIGGHEAGIWAEDLMGIYYRYSELQNWQPKIVTQYQHSNGDLATGILVIKGDRVYSKLKFESGIHEVQRYSILELKNRINTLTAHVNVMPEVDKWKIDIPDRDLSIYIHDRFFCGGPKPAPHHEVTVYHKPTHISINCGQERNQKLNTESALQILRAKINSIELIKQRDRLATNTELLPLVANDSVKIRTYNYLDNRIIDRRLIGDFDLNKVRRGDLTDLIQGCLDRDLQARLVSP